MMNPFFRKFTLLSLLAFLTLGSPAAHCWSKTNPVEVTSDEEAFLIRRIAEFWKDGDYATVKTQINEFFGKYPESSLKDYFLGILGDIYLQENDYSNALDIYQNITDSAVYEKIAINKLQCYYELDQYQVLAEEGVHALSYKTEEMKSRRDELSFLLGEAYFRVALETEEPQNRYSLAHEAKKHYDSLNPHSTYREIAAFAQAEVLSMLGEHEASALAYISLMEKHSNMQEDLLFQVGTLQARYSQEEAINTFEKVRDLNGKRSPEAIYNLLVLQFQNEKYQDVIDSYEKVASTIPENYQATFDYIVGKSFFSLGNYKNALQPLGKFISSTFIPSKQLKNALLIHMTCAHELSEEELFSTSFEKLDSLFPNDDEIPKALFMHAMILKEQGAITRADEKLRLIKERYSDFIDQESFTFEYGLLAHQNERWKESYDAFKTYTTHFTNSTRIGAAWKLFLSSALNLFKFMGEDPAVYSKEGFYQDLRSVLSNKQYLSREELRDYTLLYSKTAYELNNFRDAIISLHDEVFSKPDHENDISTLAEAHFISGLCFAEMDPGNAAFCMHLEEALALNPDLYDSAATHLQLYNAYISLAGFGDLHSTPSDSLQTRDYLDQAANHLQEAAYYFADYSDKAMK